MKILLTGASGFLGKAINAKLSKKHEVISIGRNLSNDIRCDLISEKPDLPIVDLVIHSAGLAHSIPKSESEALQFFKVNVAGTKNLLDGLTSNVLPKTIVFISSVAVYGLEKGFLITESSPLLGNTPYAKSKIEAEKLVLDWGNNHGVTIVILRLPLLSGSNPPGNLAAMAKAIRTGYYVSIGKGQARKSMVSTRDIAQLIPQLLGKSGIYNLSDGVDPTLREIEVHIAKQWAKRIMSLPMWPLKVAAKLGDVLPLLPVNSLRLTKLTSSLTFSDELARKELAWNPKPALNTLNF